MSDAAWAARWGALFTAAVERAITGPARIGTLLSGGLDSSAVACVAADRLGAGRRLDAFGNRYGPDDERAYAAEVIRAKGLRAHALDVETIDVFGELDAFIRTTEAPFDHPGALANAAIFARAGACGIDVLLDGTGGDTLVSYQPRVVAEYVRAGRPLAAVREAVLFTRRMGGAGADPVAFLAAGLLPARRGAASTTDPGLLRAPPPAPLPPPGRARPTPAQLAWAEIASPAVATAVEARQKLAAAHGFVVRMPFLDGALAAFSATLPPEQRVRDGWNRYVVRRALRDTLPRAVLERGDKFSASAAVMRMTAAALTPARRAEVRATCAALADLVDLRAVDAAMARIGPDLAAFSVRDVATVWAPFTLARWCELFSVAV